MDGFNHVVCVEFSIGWFLHQPTTIWVGETPTDKFNINDELLKRDLTEICTDVLLKMSLSNDNRVNEIVNKDFQFGEFGYIEFGINEDGYFNMKIGK